MKGEPAAAGDRAMKFKKMICVASCLTLLLAGGCLSRNKTEEIEPTYEEVMADLGESTSYGGMTLTVISAEDPDITLEDGNKAMFFKVSIINETEETVDASYLNNFTLTLNGTYYESHECCSIPVMKELYDFYGESALSTQLPPGESCTGYVACEVDKKYELIELHYIPKTTDRGSMITVSLTKEDVNSVSK